MIGFAIDLFALFLSNAESKRLGVHPSQQQQGREDAFVPFEEMLHDHDEEGGGNTDYVEKFTYNPADFSDVDEY